MSFAQIIGHKRPIATLRRAVASDRLSTGYLFAGPPNVGKATVALELAKAVNCCRRDPEAGTDEIDGCDDCEACERIAEGSFPYLGVVFPTSKALEKEIERQIRRRQEGPPAADEQEEPELELIEIEGAEIHIDRVREMLQNASLKAPTGVRKIYLIVSVEKMNFVAENHFLKVLEEPPPHTTFILTTSRPSDVAETIRSRCQVIDFNPVPAAEACRRLVEEFPERDREQIEAIAAASAGRYGWAQRMLSRPELFADRQALLDLLARLPDYQLYEGMRQAEVLVDLAAGWFVDTYEPDTVSRQTAETLLKRTADYVLRTAMIQVLDQMLSWWRDVMFVATGPTTDGLMNPDYREQIRKLAARYDVRSCRRALRWIEQAREHFRSNANLRLTTELLMLKLISLSPNI